MGRYVSLCVGEKLRGNPFRQITVVESLGKSGLLRPLKIVPLGVAVEAGEGPDGGGARASGVSVP